MDTKRFSQSDLNLNLRREKIFIITFSMNRGMPVTSMEALLDICGVREKYEQTVKREKLTLENFAKLLEMDQSGLTSTLLKRCKMTCGDFIELTKAYEAHVLAGK